MREQLKSIKRLITLGDMVHGINIKGELVYPTKKEQLENCLQYHKKKDCCKKLFGQKFCDDCTKYKKR